MGFTNTMRYTGLSGIDTQSMVEALMQAESLKYNKLLRSSTSLQWKQTAYRGVASTLDTFKKSFLDAGPTSIRFSSGFTNKTSVLDSKGQTSNAVKIKSSANAQSGSYKLNVKQLAQADKYVSENTVSGSISTSGSITADDLKEGDSFKLSLDGVSKTITFNKDDIEALQGAADSAQKFEEILNDKLATAFGKEINSADNKVWVETKKDGADGSFNFSIKTSSARTATISEATGRTFPSKIGGSVNIAEGTKELGFKVSVGGKDVTVLAKVDSSMDNEAIAKSINAALKEAGLSGQITASVDSDTGNLAFTQKGTTHDILISNYDDSPSLAQIGFNSDITLEKTSVLSNLNLKDSQNTKVDTSKTFNEIFGTEGTGTYSINGKEFTVNPTTTLKEFMDTVNKSNVGVKISLDTTSGKISMEGTKTGADNNISIDDSLKSILGFNNEPTTKAQDAIFSYSYNNGTEVTTSRDTNDVVLGSGLSLTLSAATTEEIEIIVEKDTSKTMNTIKEFVASYNSMIDELNKLTSTAKLKGGYGPLTDEEKAGMKESEIAAWEEKAKTGILYNDKIVNDITSQMRTQLYQAVELPDGSKISLYEIGISGSQNYQDKGKLVIDEDKLTKALEERGEDVQALFTQDPTSKNGAQKIAESGLGNRLNDIVNSAIGSTGTITKKAGLESNPLSALNNDIYKELASISLRMDAMNKQLIRKEEHYYLMFSRMEAAIMESNNSMSYLASMLGGGMM